MAYGCYYDKQPTPPISNTLNKKSPLGKIPKGLFIFLDNQDSDPAIQHLTPSEAPEVDAGFLDFMGIQHGFHIHYAAFFIEAGSKICHRHVSVLPVGHGNDQRPKIGHVFPGLQIHIIVIMGLSRIGHAIMHQHFSAIIFQLPHNINAPCITQIRTILGYPLKAG